MSLSVLIALYPELERHFADDGEPPAAPAEPESTPQPVPAPEPLG
jgi:hypothetical protein